MALRSLLAGSALALALAACSGGSDDAAEADAPEETAMTSPVPGEAAAVEEPEAGDDPATEPEAEAKDETPTPTPTPTATPTPTPAPAPAKVAEAAPPAAFGRCAVCHTANKGGEDKLGPNLYGTYGAKAGQGGFAYSDALKGSGLTWDEATLHSWLENPRALVPGNRMSFPGLKDAAKRQEIIDYLKQQR